MEQHHVEYCGSHVVLRQARIYKGQEGLSLMKAANCLNRSIHVLYIYLNNGIILAWFLQVKKKSLSNHVFNYMHYAETWSAPQTDRQNMRDHGRLYSAELVITKETNTYDDPVHGR